MIRYPYTTDANGAYTVLNTDKNSITDDALGGRAYYLGRIEMELPLGAGARELGLRPSIYAQFGSLFGITKPLPTATVCTTGQTGNCFPIGADGTIQPIVNNIKNSVGQVYTVPTLEADGVTTDPNGGLTTNCATGYATLGSLACSGTSSNVAAATTITPFKEVFYGSNARPRISVGVGVNWTSPFGPLRIDVAKAIVTQPGDDKKLVTFNVGTQF